MVMHMYEVTDVGILSTRERDLIGVCYAAPEEICRETLPITVRVAAANVDMHTGSVDILLGLYLPSGIMSRLPNGALKRLNRNSRYTKFGRYKIVFKK